MRYLLDTTFLIDHMRGDPGAMRRMLDLWANATAIYVNEIVVCELTAGSTVADEPEGEGLIRPLEFVQPGPDSALEAGRWRADARRRGRTLSLPTRSSAPRRGGRRRCRDPQRARLLADAGPVEAY